MREEHHLELPVMEVGFFANSYHFGHLMDIGKHQTVDFANATFWHNNKCWFEVEECAQDDTYFLEARESGLVKLCSNVTGEAEADVGMGVTDTLCVTILDGHL